MIEIIRAIWEGFCDLHKELYEKTKEEYEFLLSGEIDALNNHLKVKMSIIGKIKNLELKRKNVIEKVNGFIKRNGGDFENKKFEKEIKNTSDLVTYMRDLKIDDRIQGEIKNYNDRLIGLIGDIQSQNKKNRAFINKAMYNLKNIKKEVSGGNMISTYGPDAKEKNQTL
ncbi:MAG: flagellar export chaperone FlgN [Bacteriovoracales bacterium]|nr:flagellar export chaperone FlgN [Bacteriovoracales bacterium]